MQELLSGRRRLPGFSGDWNSPSTWEFAIRGDQRMGSTLQLSRMILDIPPISESLTSPMMVGLTLPRALLSFTQLLNYTA